jgi:hypothetical protein
MSNPVFVKVFLARIMLAFESWCCPQQLPKSDK